MEGKQLFVIYSHYQLLVSLIEAAKNPDGENNFILWNQVEMFSDFMESLKEYPFVNRVIVLPHELNDFAKKGHSFKKYYNYYSYNTDWYSKYIDFKELDELCDSGEINVFLLSNPLVLFLLRRYPDKYYRFIEEGEMAYAQNRITLINFIKRRVFKLPFDDKDNKQVKEIWVKFPDRIRVKDRSRIKPYDSQKEFRGLEKPKADAIIKAFDAEDLHSLNMGEKLMLVLTQPLSEDSLLTEEEKVEAYRRIIKEYGEGYTVVIKKHPREKTNYRLHFPDTFLISKSFPVELINLVGISFSRGVTVFSSAIYNMDSIEEKVFLGVDWHPSISEQMKKRYSSV